MTDEELDMSSRKLKSKDIKAKMFRGYENVNLSENEIESLLGIPRLSNVESLNLTRNRLGPTVEFRHIAPCLQKLNLSYNYLDKISGLETLTRLRTLNLAGNWISECTGLENLVRLHYLDLCDNLIDSFQSVRSLSFNKNLRTLLLKGNPIASSRSGAYGLSVLNLLPHLDRVDRWTTARFRKNNNKKKKEKTTEVEVPLLLRNTPSARTVKSTSSYAEIHLGVTPGTTPRPRRQEKNAIVPQSFTPTKRLNFSRRSNKNVFNKNNHDKSLRVRPVDETTTTRRTRKMKQSVILPKSAMKAKRRISLQTDERNYRLRQIFEENDENGTGALPVETVVNILCVYVSGMTREEAVDLCVGRRSGGEDNIRYLDLFPSSSSSSSSSSSIMSMSSSSSYTRRRDDQHTTVKKKKNTSRKRIVTTGKNMNTKKMNKEKIRILRNKLRAASYIGTRGTDLQVLFERFDKDHNGYLSRSEFAQALRKRVRLSKMELNVLWNIVDCDGSGSVDLEEFSRFLNMKKKGEIIEEEVTPPDVVVEEEGEQENNESLEIETLLKSMILNKECALERMKLNDDDLI